MEIDRHIFLIGFMGSGKTAVSEALSLLTGIRRCDTDDIIAGREGMTVSDIFALNGEAFFREKETELLVSLKEEAPMIISCGGGMALSAVNRKLMKEAGRTVLLTASCETILERLRGDNSRPLLSGRKTCEEISELMDSRRPYYEEAADMAVDTDHLSPEEISEEIINKISSLS